MSEDINKSTKSIVLEEYKKGNIVFEGIEGLVVANLQECIEQPTEGLLYDLNRNKETVLTFIDDPKWVNDYAVAVVITELKSRITELEKPYETGHYHDPSVAVCGCGGPLHGSRDAICHVCSPEPEYLDAVKNCVALQSQLDSIRDEAIEIEAIDEDDMNYFNEASCLIYKLADMKAGE